MLRPRRRIGVIFGVAVLFAALAQPVAASGDDVKSLGTNDYHSCVVKTDGSLWCWGSNEYHQIGDGADTTNRLTPVRVEKSDGVFISGFKSVSPSGYDHTCGLKSDLTVRCWGDNEDGQLGAGDTAEHDFPVTVLVDGSLTTLKNVKQLAVGQNHSCALKKNGTVWCWGSNSSGELGEGTTDQHLAAVQVKTGASTFLTSVASIGVGWNHSCAVMIGGTATCWGANQYAQLGLGTADGDSHPFPEPVSGLSGVTTIDGGIGHTCALKSNATLRCWGNNDNRQIGNDDDVNAVVLTPAVVVKATGTLKGVTSFAAGALHTCAVTNGKPFCWGSNSNGEIAQGESLNHSAVALRVRVDEVTLFSGASKIVAGDSATCILKTDMTVWCVGYAEYGQIGYSETPDGTVYFLKRVAFP